MNRIVSIYVRYKDHQGKRCFVPAAYAGKARLQPQPGAVYYIRWYEGSKPKAKKVGTDPADSLKAQMRQEASRHCLPWSAACRLRRWLFLARLSSPRTQPLHWT